MLIMIDNSRDESLSLKRILNSILVYLKGKSSAKKRAKKSLLFIQHRCIKKTILNCILVYEMLILLIKRYKDMASIKYISTNK